MQAFDTHTGLVAPLDRANVDTDQIIPKQFLKSIRRTGFGDNLFDAWRFRDEGDMTKTANEREINRDFVLNEPRYQGASVLVTRTNFGCGSSREHAVWALLEYGFRCVIAPSFADIFAGNSLQNGLLLVTLPDSAVGDLIERAQTVPGFSLTVNLPAQTVARRRLCGIVRHRARAQAALGRGTRRDRPDAALRRCHPHLRGQAPAAHAVGVHPAGRLRTAGNGLPFVVGAESGTGCRPMDAARTRHRARAAQAAMHGSCACIAP